MEIIFFGGYTEESWDEGKLHTQRVQFAGVQMFSKANHSLRASFPRRSVGRVKKKEESHLSNLNICTKLLKLM